MKIVIAPDKFKGCLDAAAVAGAIARGVRAADPGGETDLCPVADGGEGTVAALVAATGGRIETRRVTGPLPERKVEAAFGVLGDGQTAVIEMAAASGLALITDDERDPERTSTYGTGQLICAAVDAGASVVLVAVGGAATVDGGAGALEASADHGGSGEPSRWNNARDLEWVKLRPELVVEIAFDHTSNDRIRHGAKLLRWRDDKDPADCRMDQLLS